MSKIAPKRDIMCNIVALLSFINLGRKTNKISINKTPMKKLLLSLAVLSLFTFNTFGQTSDKKISVGVFGGSIQYNGDLGSGLMKMSPFYGFAGISLATYVSKHFDFMFDGSSGEAGYSEESFNVKYWTINASVKYKFCADESKKLLPYAFAGVGYMRFEKKYSLSYPIEIVQIPQAGLGLTYRVTPIVNINLQVAFIYSDRDDVDGVKDQYNDMYLAHSLGVSFNLGKCKTKAVETVKDSDGDGVVDKKDKCPGTPAGVKVDVNGCPLDTDGDGVLDYLDKCLGTPVAVKVDANGCPVDTDGDGIVDYLDKCPTVKGIAANKGCPEIKVEEKKIFNEALQGIQFETGSDVIIPSSFKILDNVVAIMNSNPQYNLAINGHTDNVGTPESNLVLSQKRAESVKVYLINKGIGSKRLAAKGFGETKPVSDNTTDAGRAQNRRVEFVVEF